MDNISPAPNVDNSTENNNLSSQYQSILDKYAADLAVASPQNTPETQPIVPPPQPPSPPPEVFASTPIPSSNPFFKILFYLSLVIFLVVLGANVYLYFQKNQSASNPPQPTLTAKPTEKIAASFCESSNQKYEVGQSFSAADGCNTCTCTQDLIIDCTTNICPTATPTSKLAATTTVSSLFKAYNTSFAMVFKPISTDYTFSLNQVNILKPAQSLDLTKYQDGTNLATVKKILTDSGLAFDPAQSKQQTTDWKEVYISPKVICHLVGNQSGLSLICADYDYYDTLGYPLGTILKKINASLKTNYQAVANKDEKSNSYLVTLTKSSSKANILAIKSAITSTGFVLSPELSGEAGSIWKEVYVKNADTCELESANSELTLSCHR